MRKWCILLLVIDLIGLALCWWMHSDTAVKTGSSQDEVYIKQTQEGSKVALTFDDGPNPQWTPKLLDGLKERGIQATFFVIGEKAKESPELIKRMIEEGHIVGNHTFSHIQLTTVATGVACEEITKTNQTIYDITGEYPIYIRPPFGAWNDTLECGVELMPVMWSVDTLDWTTSNKARIVEKAVNHIEDNDIILMHDDYESSVQAALEIVDRLTKQGFEFVTVEELLLD